MGCSAHHSYLCDVLDRKEGAIVPLAILYAAVARRLGVGQRQSRGENSGIKAVSSINPTPKEQSWVFLTTCN